MSKCDGLVRSFFSAYLHQDWQEEYASSLEAANDYSYCGEIADRISTLEGLQRLIDLSNEGGFYEDDLLNFGCYYLPSRDGYSLPEWLYLIKEVMESGIKNRQKTE